MSGEIPLIQEMLIPSMSRAVKHVQILQEKRLSQSDAGLTLKQFIVLHMSDSNTCSQSELAFITDRDKGSLTRLIQSLERKGFVTRSASRLDKRTNLIQVTNAGKAAMEVARKVVLDTFEEVTRDINRSDEQLIVSCSEDIMKHAKHLLATTTDNA